MRVYAWGGEMNDGIRLVSRSWRSQRESEFDTERKFYDDY